MNYMLNLPFSTIKIDKGIIWSSFKSERAAIALSATIAMIKKLHMNIIAEGVETIEHVKRLGELGCDYLQGYYFSEPVPADAFIALLERQHDAWYSSPEFT
jgi:EAL domain-containing protein (putative c-di-GMP-specific phosphodiesterase class I)